LTYPNAAIYDYRAGMITYKLVVVGPLETNCYLVYCSETLECAVIDPGAEAERIFPSIIECGLKPVVILNTHGHIDHVGANRDVKDKFKIPLWIHGLDGPLLEKIQEFELSFFLGAKESPPPDRLLKDGESVVLGRSALQVIHTPGHTAGSVSFLGNNILFSGDTLFNGGVGRTDLPGGSSRDLETSIRERILVLPSETIVLPGHGPWTTVGDEKESNPFLG
jgi:hydroxyacylglutathione hydrolase